MLARHAARPEIIEFAQSIRCSICAELSRKPSEPVAGGGSLQPKAFRDIVIIDEFFVSLTDGYRVVLIMIQVLGLL